MKIMLHVEIYLVHDLSPKKSMFNAQLNNHYSFGNTDVYCNNSVKLFNAYTIVKMPSMMTCVNCITYKYKDAKNNEKISGSLVYYFPYVLSCTVPPHFDVSLEQQVAQVLPINLDHAAA